MNLSKYRIQFKTCEAVDITNHFTHIINNLTDLLMWFLNYFATGINYAINLLATEFNCPPFYFLSSPLSDWVTIKAKNKSN